jgi:hypothetical protein
MIRSIALTFFGCMLAAAPALSQMKPPTPLTATQFAHATPGQALVLAVRVTIRERDALRADLLERRDDAHYRSTGTTVELYYPQDTPVVMGSSADVKTGAVLFVRAVATTPGHADAKQITVVTPYVSVQ